HRDRALLQGEIIEVAAGNPLPRGHAGFYLPKLLLAVGQAQGPADILADQYDLPLEHARQVQVVPAVGLPEGGAVLEVETMNGPTVRGGEHHLAILDDWGGHFPVLAELLEVTAPILRGHSRRKWSTNPG